MTPAPKEGPPTMTPPEKDDHAWNRIVTLIVAGFFEMAKTIFLTRCAESAQEALAEGETRGAALEELFQEVGIGLHIAGDLTLPLEEVQAQMKVVRAKRDAIVELDALTAKHNPTTQEKA